MKIGITGAQSVGKTSLIMKLKETPFFKDYFVHQSPSRYLKKGYGIGFDTANTDTQLATLALQLYHINHKSHNPQLINLISRNSHLVAQNSKMQYQRDMRLDF